MHRLRCTTCKYMQQRQTHRTKTTLTAASDRVTERYVTSHVIRFWPISLHHHGQNLAQPRSTLANACHVLRGHIARHRHKAQEPVRNEEFQATRNHHCTTSCLKNVRNAWFACPKHQGPHWRSKIQRGSAVRGDWMSHHNSQLGITVGCLHHPPTAIQSMSNCKRMKCIWPLANVAWSSHQTLRCYVFGIPQPGSEQVCGRVSSRGMRHHRPPMNDVKSELCASKGLVQNKLHLIPTLSTCQIVALRLSKADTGHSASWGHRFGSHKVLSTGHPYCSC